MNDYLNVSNISYDVDKFVAIDLNLDKQTIRSRVQSIGTIPEHLEYLDSFYDSSGVSGVAFKNVNTGEVIIGFTGTNESKDWKNNINSIAFSEYDYAEPAYRFYEDMRNIYGDNITLTGHSQGGGLAQRVAIEYNVQKTIVFNPAPLYTGLLNVTADTLKKRRQIDEKADNFTGKVLRFQAEGDVLNNGAKLVLGRYIGDNYILHDAGWHMLDEILASPYLVNNIDKVVSEYFESPILVDLNKDGVNDVDMQIKNRSPKNLLANDVNLSGTIQPIQVNADVLRILADNLMRRVNEDIAEITKLTNLCIQNNRSVNLNFEQRKKLVTESIRSSFMETGFTGLLYDLQESIGYLLDRPAYFSELSRGGLLQMHLFANNQVPLVDGMNVQFLGYNSKIRTLQKNSSEILMMLTKEHRFTGAGFLPSECQLIKSLEYIDHGAKTLLDESDRVFEGEGFRVGKKDGISESLATVLSKILENTQELALSISSVAELVRGLATNFTEVDNWIGKQITQGRFVNNFKGHAIPVSYQAYLGRDEIFDDVKDVLQAFDRQVEQNSAEYAKKVAMVFENTFNKLKFDLQTIFDKGVQFNKSVRSVVNTFDKNVYVQESKTIFDSEVNIINDDISEKYWGKLSELYPSYIVYNVKYAYNHLMKRFDNIQHAIFHSESVKRHLTQLHPELKRIIESGVYKAFELNEMIQSQKVVSSIATRLGNEIQHVIDVIDGDGMQAQAITTLKQKLSETRQLIGFYTQFINDCFGNNENSGYVAQSGGGNKHMTFSLN